MLHLPQDIAEQYNKSNHLEKNLSIWQTWETVLQHTNYRFFFVILCLSGENIFGYLKTLII